MRRSLSGGRGVVGTAVAGGATLRNSESKILPGKKVTGKDSGVLLNSL